MGSEDRHSNRRSPLILTQGAGKGNPNTQKGCGDHSAPSPLMFFSLLCSVTPQALDNPVGAAVTAESMGLQGNCLLQQVHL